MKILTVDMSSVESIQKAEREKARLENAGFSYVKTQQIGLDKFVSYYKEPPKENRR